ncbi:MAG: type I 3-dehydroquinate dehydratase, partial [Vicinamibacterales bacterium]
MSALVCETVTATSMAELRAARDRATDADLVELRLDGVTDVDVAGALAGRRRPVIVTCRPSWEGGRWNGFEAKRL